MSRPDYIYELLAVTGHTILVSTVKYEVQRFIHKNKCKLTMVLRHYNFANKHKITDTVTMSQFEFMRGYNEE